MMKMFYLIRKEQKFTFSLSIMVRQNNITIKLLFFFGLFADFQHFIEICFQVVFVV